MQLAHSLVRPIVAVSRKVQVNRVTTAALVLLMSASASLTPSLAQAKDKDKHKNRQARHEQKWDRRESQQAGYWDPAREYRRDDRRNGPRRLGRNDRIYRGSDDRYYCKRDDGTTGLILGGIAGGALGNIIAPGGSKTLGTIVGAGAGAWIGKAMDDGDIVCS